MFNTFIYMLRYTEERRAPQLALGCSHLIDQPMYFFLSLSSAMDLCCTPTIVPQMNLNLLVGSKTIKFSNCLAHLFAVHFFDGVEIFILVGMAYDCYIAICKPLHFMALDHFFCDVKPLLKLVCTDTYTINVSVVANSGTASLITFFILVISYAAILYNLRTYSAQVIYRALSTCSSHITVVVIYFVPYIFTYTLPLNTIGEDHMFAVLYTVVAPILNPFIYTLRKLEMKLWYKKAFLG
ncbi:olfactory receptor 4P4-like [Tachyglossus aculeatus]|uniref:olfactory receptor 4P4-like n=1 Tax=Tachyglossus aculeatus TaxID=9261 RepID=UPI0018F5D75B|nr:olfactory receptor 4P4-like [Tachyglossus aculeatus]